MKSHTLAIKRLSKEYQMLQAKPVKNIEAIPCPENIFEWHFVLYDLDSPYVGGYYHGKLIFPGDYPFNPPDLIFITPNGRFKPGIKICLSFTSYHPDKWSVNWNVESMLIGLISFMYTNEHTVGGVVTSPEMKQKLAKESLGFNLSNQDFVKVFKGSFETLGILMNEESVCVKNNEIDNEDASEINKTIDKTYKKEMIGNTPSKSEENKAFLNDIKTNKLKSGSNTNRIKKLRQINYQNLLSKPSHKKKFIVKDKEDDMANFKIFQTSHLKTNLMQNFTKFDVNTIEEEIPDKIRLSKKFNSFKI